MRSLHTLSPRLVFFFSFFFMVLVSLPTTAARAMDIDPDDAVLGPADAKVTIVAFLDLECPNSRKLYPSLRKLAAKYPDGVRIVFKHFPLTMHKTAKHLAQVAQCAEAQNKLFEVADAIYGDAFECLDCIPKVLADAGVDGAAHAACMKNPASGQAVGADMAYGKSLGVSATPTMFINGEKLEGAISYRQLRYTVKDDLE